jgi:hypothetical protein
MGALGHTSAALSLEVYGRVVAGATTGLGKGMAKLVRAEWAPMGTSSVEEQVRRDEAAMAAPSEKAD